MLSLSQICADTPRSQKIEWSKTSYDTLPHSQVVKLVHLFRLTDFCSPFVSNFRKYVEASSPSILKWFSYMYPLDRN